MEALLLEWGTEIILSLVIAFLTYHFKKSDAEKDKTMAHYQELLDHEQEEKTKKAVEVQLEPIYKELEEIRKRVFALQDCHTDDITTQWMIGKKQCAKRQKQILKYSKIIWN